MINDGSQDHSVSILEEYAYRDDRIRVISKMNEGVSIARNIALKQAKGEWVYFVDADDIVYPEALKMLVAKTLEEDVSLVKADYKAIGEMDEELFVNKKYVIRGKQDIQIWNKEDFVDKIIMGEYFLWTCLFKMDIIRNREIEFLPHCRLMEDADFLISYILHSNRNVYLNYPVYGYRKHCGAATVGTKDYSEDLLMIKEHLSPNTENTFIKKMISEIDDNLRLMKKENFFIVQFIKIKRLMGRIGICISYKL